MRPRRKRPEGSEPEAPKDPSKVYRYGSRVPTEGLETVRDHFRLAHQYRNALVEIELTRRAAVDKLLNEFSPGLARVEAALGVKARWDGETETETPATGLEAEVDAAETVVNRERAAARSRTKRSVTPAAENLRALKARRAELYAQRKDLRKKLFANRRWRAQQKEINTADHDARIKARSECGLFWGTYLAVEEAADSFRKGAPPSFRPWAKRKDRLGVQLQKGLSVAKLLAGTDTRLRLTFVEREPRRCDGCMASFRRERRGEPEPRDARPCTCASMPKESKRRAPHAILWFRVGSAGRAPVWAQIPVTYHRPLPEDGTIKWAYLIRRSIGVNDEWSVHLVLSRPSWAPGDQATRGAVGIDVGWRRLPDGALRVAVWSGSDGCEGEIALPRWWAREQARVDGIRSERDKLMNEHRDLASAWLRSNKDALPTGEDAPQWLAHTEAIHAWKAPQRLARLVREWESAPLKLPGEAALLERLVTWRSEREMHLLHYESHLRDQLQGARLDLYRVAAAKLSRRYATAVIEDMDLRKFHRLPATEEGQAWAERTAKEYVRDACLSDLRTALRQRMRETTKVPAKHTTMQCHACGHVDEEWKGWASEVLHTCPSCGLTSDQDVNASRNLLAASSGPPVHWHRKPLAPTERWSYDPGKNTRRERTEAGWRALETKRKNNDRHSA